MAVSKSAVRAKAKHQSAPRSRVDPAELRAAINAAWEKSNSYIVSEHWRLNEARRRGGKRARPIRALKRFDTTQHLLETRALERLMYYKHTKRLLGLAAERKTAKDLDISVSELQKKILAPARRVRPMRIEYFRDL